MISEEEKRFALQLELQVLRQRYSLVDLDDPEQPELKQATATCQKRLKECTSAIYEILEELREEAADLED